MGKGREDGPLAKSGIGCNPGLLDSNSVLKGMGKAMLTFRSGGDRAVT